MVVGSFEPARAVPENARRLYKTMAPFCGLQVWRPPVLWAGSFFVGYEIDSHAACRKAPTMKPGGKLSKAALARAQERLRHSNPINHFGFVLEKAEKGHAVFRMPVLELHKQIHRVVHGGVLAMLADTAGGFAAFLAAPVGARVVTIEMKINFLEAVERGEIRADARVLRQGRSTSVVDCDVRDEDQRLVSKALMTFAIISPKKN
jgi:uncharacterized protein (TIGR00369 family)